MYKTEAKVTIISSKPIKRTGLVLPNQCTDVFMMLEIQSFEPSVEQKETPNVFGEV
jgi:hypothetical protein